MLLSSMEQIFEIKDRISSASPTLNLYIEIGSLLVRLYTTILFTELFYLRIYHVGYSCFLDDILAASYTPYSPEFPLCPLITVMQLFQPVTYRY